MSATQQSVDAYFSESARYWNEVYAGDTVPSTIYRERREVVLSWVDELQRASEDNALDLGCGAGLFSVALAKRGFRVRAIDTVEAMRAQASVLAFKEGVQEQVILEEGDAHQLNYADASFDLVLAVGVTPWLHSLATALNEIYRILRPGGHLIVTADNQRRLTYWLDPRFCPLHAPLRSTIGRLLRKRGLRHQPHAFMYSVSAFDAALETAGLEKIKGVTLGYGPFTFFDHKLLSDRAGVALHHKLKALSVRSPLLRSAGSQYMVLARKDRRTPQFHHRKQS